MSIDKVGDILFFKVFRNVYLRRNISNVLYVSYEIRSEKALKSFEETMTKMDDHRKNNYKNYTPSNYLSGSSCLYVNELILHKGIDIEDYNGSMILYLEQVISYIKSSNDDRILIFYLFIKNAFKDNYEDMKIHDKKSIINLLLSHIGQYMRDVIPMFSTNIPAYEKKNITRDEYFTNLYNVLQNKYIELKNYEKNIISYCKMFNIFYNTFSVIADAEITIFNRDIYNKDVYELYIRYIYLGMMYFTYNQKDVIFYNLENIDTTQNCIEDVVLLQILNSMFHNYKIYEEALNALDYMHTHYIHKNNHVPFIHYEYSDNYSVGYIPIELNGKILGTRASRHILKSIIKSRIDYKSIYKEVYEIVKQELSNK